MDIIVDLANSTLPPGVTLYRVLATGPIRSLAVSPDGSLVAAGGFSTATLWETRTGRRVRTMKKARRRSGEANRPFDSIAFSPDSRLLAGGQGRETHGAVTLWEVATGNVVSTREEHSGPVGAIVFSPNGRLLASGSQDESICLWDPETGELQRTLSENDGWINSLAFSPQGTLLASTSYSGVLRLWDSTTGRVRQALEVPEKPPYAVYSAAFSADGRLLASGDSDALVRVWDVTTGDLLLTLHGHTRSVYSVALSPDGRLLISQSYDGSVRFWHLPTGTPVATLPGPISQNSHAGLAFPSSLPLLAMAGASSGTVANATYDSQIHLYAIDSDRLLDNAGLAH